MLNYMHDLVIPKNPGSLLILAMMGIAWAWLSLMHMRLVAMMMSFQAVHVPIS